MRARPRLRETAAVPFRSMRTDRVDEEDHDDKGDEELSKHDRERHGVASRVHQDGQHPIGECTRL